MSAHQQQPAVALISRQSLLPGLDYVLNYTTNIVTKKNPTCIGGNTVADPLSEKSEGRKKDIAFVPGNRIMNLYGYSWP